MEDIKDGSIVPSESSKKTTRDFINASADKAPDKISRGFIQAGIISMNPAPVCDALGVEAVCLHYRDHRESNRVPNEPRIECTVIS
jgi:hypothetical protein